MRSPASSIFVHEYLDSNRAPDARPFLARFAQTSVDRGGELWNYAVGRAARPLTLVDFTQIDWGRPVREAWTAICCFEDLKAQWAAGRQSGLRAHRLAKPAIPTLAASVPGKLPDSVAILFFPNAQNLRGLTKVVHDIRSETGETAPQDR